MVHIYALGHIIGTLDKTHLVHCSTHPNKNRNCDGKSVTAASYEVTMQYDNKLSLAVVRLLQNH